MSKKCKTATIHWKIYNKKGSAALAWRLRMKAMPDEGPIWADDAN